MSPLREERDELERRVTLLELLDRLIDNGVVVHGDITLAIADIDLVYVGLRALITSVHRLERDHLPDAR